MIFSFNGETGCIKGCRSSFRVNTCFALFLLFSPISEGGGASDPIQQRAAASESGEWRAEYLGEGGGQAEASQSEASGSCDQSEAGR